MSSVPVEGAVQSIALLKTQNTKKKKKQSDTLAIGYCVTKSGYHDFKVAGVTKKPRIKPQPAPVIDIEHLDPLK